MSSPETRLAPYRADGLGALYQGRQLRNFVREEGVQFAELWPDKVARYGRSILRASKNVARIASSSKEHKLWAFVVEENRDFPPRTAIGIGTVATEQAIVHPSVPGRVIVGTDIDYVLAQRLEGNRDVHDRVATKLLQGWPARWPSPNAGTITEDAVYLQNPMRTIIVGQPNPPLGRTTEKNFDYWRPFGSAGPLEVPGDDDQLGMAKGRQPLQLYVSPDDYLLLERAQSAS